MKTKQCTTCKEVKPASEYYKDTRHKDGMKNECKDCWRARSRRRHLRLKNNPPQFPEDITKCCFDCKEEKLLNEFRKIAVGKLGVTHICKECQSASDRESRGNPWGWAAEVCKGAKHRAKIKGLSFDITVEDIYEKIIEYCPIFPDIRISFNNVGKRGDDSPSLDRIDSSKGYTIVNIQVISWRANRLKSNSTPEERRLLHEHDKSYEERCVIQPAFTFKSFLDSIDSILQENAHP